MSSSPTAPTSTTGSSTCSPSRADGPADRVALVACGALAQPAAADRRAPRLAGRRPPAAAAAAQPPAADRRRGAPPGRRAAADVRRGRGGVRRLRHLRRPRRGVPTSSGCGGWRGCTATTCTPARTALAALLDEQPGTYLLTDFLVRSFERTVRPRARARPLARAARRLLRPLHAGGVAGPGAGRRAARARRSRPPTGSGCR